MMGVTREVRWAEGSHPVKGVRVEDAARILYHIEKRDGGVRPAAVLRAAKADSSPIHPWFEWDDRTAAGRWREEQARHLIRSVVVRTIPPETERSAVVTTRAFVVVHAGSNGQCSYQSVERAMSDPVSRSQVLDRAYRELESFRARYRGLEELAGVMDAIASAIPDPHAESA